MKKLIIILYLLSTSYYAPARSQGQEQTRTFAQQNRPMQRMAPQTKHPSMIERQKLALSQMQHQEKGQQEATKKVNALITRVKATPLSGGSSGYTQNALVAEASRHRNDPTYIGALRNQWVKTSGGRYSAQDFDKSLASFRSPSVSPGTTPTYGNITTAVVTEKGRPESPRYQSNADNFFSGYAKVLTGI